MRLSLLLSLVFLFSVPFSTFAQKDTEIEHLINSTVFEKERKVRVFLPERYFRDTTATLAVTYVLDAQSDRFWNAVTGNGGYLVNNYSVMPMIFVGIVSDDRGSEFDPDSFMLQDHIEKEVFPLIEKEYRTDNFRAILGHSWGGAFVGNTLFSNRKDMFNGYIGISPSFGDTDNIIQKNAESLLKENTTFGKYLYFSYGDVGRRELEFGGYVKSISELLATYPNSSLKFEPRLIERVGHWQIVGPSVCDGLISMSRNYFADQWVLEQMVKNEVKDLKTEVAKFNSTQETTFGYIHKASGRYFNFVANDFRDLEDYNTALQVYELAVADKDDVKVYVNISDTYYKLGDKIKAKASFLKTQQLLEEQKEDVSENYYKNVGDWIKEKLAELD